MPIPIPHSDDKKDDYIPRCMRFTVGEEKRPQDQAFAICIGKWNEHLRNSRKSDHNSGDDMPDDEKSLSDDEKSLANTGDLDTLDFIINLKSKGLL